MADDDDGRSSVLAEEQAKRLRARNRALAWALGVLVVLFWLVTVFKMGGNVANRPL